MCRFKAARYLSMRTHYRSIAILSECFYGSAWGCYGGIGCPPHILLLHPHHCYSFCRCSTPILYSFPLYLYSYLPYSCSCLIFIPATRHRQTDSIVPRTSIAHPPRAFCLIYTSHNESHYPGYYRLEPGHAVYCWHVHPCSGFTMIRLLGRIGCVLVINAHTDDAYFDGCCACDITWRNHRIPDHCAI